MASPAQSDLRHAQSTGLAHIPAQTVASTRCRRCAGTSPSGCARIVGVWSVINGRAAWDCPACARAHLFEIETGIAHPS